MRKSAGFISVDFRLSDSVFDFYRVGRLCDYVITVCDQETESQCPVFAGLTHRLHWPFPDPETVSGTPEEKLKATREIRDQIKQKVANWLNEMKDPT